MSFQDYEKALRLGEKAYKSCLSKGQYPYLQSLDETLSYTDTAGEINLGLVEVPLDQIMGTKSDGRRTAFASNFMPLLGVNSEFAIKWRNLFESLTDDGLRDPIKAYEYMNHFYVAEGNKRVSVMKYLGAVTISATVTRIMPKHQPEDLEHRLYFEYVRFYAVSGVNFIWFSKEGSFDALLDLVHPENPQQQWTTEDRSGLRAIYTYFKNAFLAADGGKLSLTPGDALLAYLTVYGYPQALSASPEDFKTNLSKIWNELLALTQEEAIQLSMQPAQKPAKGFLGILKPSTPEHLKVTFIHNKTTDTSGWTYGHELGRAHLDNVFKGKITTDAVSDVQTREDAKQAIETAIENKSHVIFTTTPRFLAPSLSCAVEHPEVKILNCSLNTPHPYLRTYYGRMFEAKFLIGAVAGAMAENNKIGYVADYPIYGSTASINAFALGAKTVNPRAKIYLEWSSRAEAVFPDMVNEQGVSLISGPDFITPGAVSREFGLYRVEGINLERLAMPVWHWGRFYEHIIESILNGSWKNEGDGKANRALNYWWGMSVGVIDVICAKNLPIGTKRLVQLLKRTIARGDFNPFSGVLYSQEGLISDALDGLLSPEEIITMDWLSENVIGTIPTLRELKDTAKDVVLLQGLLKE